MTGQQVPLFDYDPPTPPTPYRRPDFGRSTRVRWSRLAGHAAGSPCDDCMQLHVERPDAPLARRARWHRRHEGLSRYLCPPHAAEWREADGKGPLSELEVL